MAVEANEGAARTPFLTKPLMTSLNDEQLVQYGERSKGKVVLITGEVYRNVDVLASFADYLV